MLDLSLLLFANKVTLHFANLQVYLLTLHTTAFHNFSNQHSQILAWTRENHATSNVFGFSILHPQICLTRENTIHAMS